MTRKTDTDGIYDRCHCGARAQAHSGDVHRVDCTECAETTGPCCCRVCAMVRWNRKMRGLTK
jgi:hypothetical protein